MSQGCSACPKLSTRFFVPISGFTMHHFQIRHVFRGTIVVAIAFAIASQLYYEQVFNAFAYFAVCAPIMSYFIAAFVSGDKHTRRRLVQYSLLAGLLTAFAKTYLPSHNLVFHLPMIALLSVLWLPQLLLLEIYSGYRSDFA